ncbi:MAG: S41 family peptidase [Candidatus Melainabacteria bacterium]|nr:S41 family peptidase [Candidatus Melainabacteria bacterium]
MKIDSTNSTAASGLAIFRWATSATLALILASLLGSAVAFLLIYSLGHVEALKPFMPSVSEVLFTLGTTGTPLVLSYLYFTGRTAFVTTWSQKLHPFFHLDSNLPNFPKVLGFNYRLVGMTFKKIAMWAIGGFALTYLFDYATDAFIHIGPTGTEAAVSSNVGAPSGPQGIEQVLAHMSMPNFLMTAVLVALLAAFMEEMVFRGVIFNLWRTSFATQAEELSNSSSTFGRAVHKFLSVCGSSIAILIAAALFALAHLNLDAFLSEFFFGLVAGALYLVTRTIWTPVLLHVVTNSVLPIVILIGGLTGNMNSDTSGHNHSSAGTTQAQNLGIRVPGVREAIMPTDGSKASLSPKPLVGEITQEDLHRADFNASGNSFIQVCIPEQCQTERAFLESLAKQYPDIEFYQADTSKNAGLVQKLVSEQAVVAKDKTSNETTTVSYPVYIYANNSLQIAPSAAKSEKDLKTFIETNYTVYGEVAEDKDDLMAPYVSAACNPENTGLFNGKTLYACAFDMVLKTDLSIIDREKRATFSQKWQHKFDEGSALDSQERTEKAIREMLADLNEMHTNFFTAKQFANLAQAFDSSLAGIGAPVTLLNMANKAEALSAVHSQDTVALAQISDDTPLMFFPRPNPGSPAEAAGIAAGDRIAEVNGKQSSGRTVNEIVADIRGPAGTTVTIKVLRPTSAGFEPLTFNITRAQVHTKEATWQKIDNGFASIKVGMFGNSVSREFTEALYEACTGKPLPEGKAAVAAIVNTYKPEQDCQLKGLAIDLQNNPGGRLDQVVEMLQAVMKEGTLVSYLSREGDQIIHIKESVSAGEFRREKIVNGKSEKVFTHPRFWRVLPDNIPVVVMINENSASAAELMSASLQKNGLAAIVGTPSYGKEVGQSVNPLDFGTGVKITTFRFLPAGSDLGVAVLPDFEASQSTAYLNDPLSAPDLVLNKAQEVLAMGKDALAEARSAAVTSHKENLAASASAAHKERDNAILASQKSGLLQGEE